MSDFTLDTSSSWSAPPLPDDIEQLLADYEAGERALQVLDEFRDPR